MKFRFNKGLGLLWISAAVLALDQVTKLIVLENLAQSIPVIPGLFNLTLVRNPGAAWGIFRAYPTALTLLAAGTLVVLLLFGSFFQGSSCWTRAGWALLVGGIAGNMIDRIRFGSVVDFLDFYIGASHWPAFNVADSAICVGVICYVIDSFRRKSDSAAKEAVRETA